MSIRSKEEQMRGWWMGDSGKMRMREVRIIMKIQEVNDRESRITV